MLKVGTCLNHMYTLMEEIGSGGGGIIYKAYHENLKKYVVVKQIKDIAKDVLNSRGEADILKNLRNTYLPQVYDFLEIDGEIFTVIDFIEGESLDKALAREGRFPYKDVLKWALQLSDALAYLHSQVPPVIHSDIKPANIMLTPQGDICLIDFNISMAFDQSVRTSAGISEGYSPPEQYHNYSMYCSIAAIGGDENADAYAGGSVRRTRYAGSGQGARSGQADGVRHTRMSGQAPASVPGQGQASQGTPYEGQRITRALVGRGVDERSDVYSLGATLYHLLTGICPSSNFEEIVPLSKCRVTVSEGFTLIIEKMMQLVPENRYRSGKEIQEALKNIVQMDSAYKEYRRKRKASFAALAALYAASAALIAGGLGLMGRERDNWYNATVAQAEAYIENGEYTQAASCIEEAIGRMPTRIGAYEAEVLRLYESGDYESCVSYGRNTVNSPEYYVQTESDEESLGNILYVMGNAYYELEEYDNALNCMNMAIEYNTGNSSYYRDLGITLAKTGNTAQAEEILSQAEELGLAQDSIYMIQGEIAYGNNQAEEAIELFQTALNVTDSDSTRRRCISFCARAYQMLGDDYLDEEIAFLEEWRGVLGASSSMQITESLAEAYARKGDYEQSLALFDEIRSQGYASYQILENIAILYQQSDQLDAAEATLQEMNEQYPDRYRTYKRLAFLEADRQQRKANSERDYTQMKAYYETALVLYEGQDEYDAEMDQLANMMRELEAGNWF